MRRNRITLGLLLFLIVLSGITTAQGNDSEEYICKNVTWFTFSYNHIILSKHLNTVETPRRWMMISKGFVPLSFNPDIDNEKLNQVYEKLKERLNKTSTGQDRNIKIVSITLRSAEGKEWEEYLSESREYHVFYIVVELEHGCTFVYNGALIRIGVPLADTTWSELRGGRSNYQVCLEDKVYKAVGIPLGNIIKELEKNWLESSEKLLPYKKEFLCNVYQIGEVEKKSGGKIIRLKDLKETMQWHEGLFSHLQYSHSNYFLRQGGKDIERLWDIANIYSLYYESKGVISDVLKNLQNIGRVDSPKPEKLSLNPYSGEIAQLEKEINFFISVLNLMEYWVGLMRENPLFDMNPTLNEWAYIRSTIVDYERIAQLRLDQYRQVQTVRYAELAICISVVAVFISVLGLVPKKKSGILIVGLTAVSVYVLWILIGSLIVVSVYVLWIPIAAIVIQKYRSSKYDETSVLEEKIEAFKKELETLKDITSIIH
jgi:hypothetical protein